MSVSPTLRNRMAFWSPPQIFAYLLVLGAEHTSSLRRCALSVLVFAVISEVPYDLAMTGQPWDWSEQNSLWTVFIALVMLWLMKRFQGSGMVPLLLCLLFVAAGWASWWRMQPCSATTSS